ncbi:tetrathionate reductase family octaheme c-type cytochrome [Pseudomonas sp. GOM7]|uniref:tetrathionate reductase family octaheme c-type cytochrome n=1 Tax=Pseudomonas sp. GOM7 TaxID=2998079 RepID=UPI00227C8F58|nr:tetrathionate reductase family octaheme c-type cytochrome [Pseudomonas sp. GOM7]WAJ39552.1 tetrathionate reductase family octaheme c-type cytochrome [Pseudomonas sp. GOM7]
MNGSRRASAGFICLLLLLPGPALAATADHGRFKELQGPFASGEDVTRACLGCHTEAAKQVMASRHWTWDYINPDTGQRLGKKTMINGFCIGDRSNEAFCQSCHVGYGWQDASFDFSDQSKVDCLACHNTGNYLKLAGLAGHPPLVRSETSPGSGTFVDPVDLAIVARNIGATSRQSCGACHYYGGGGDGVKHGDLDSSLNDPPRSLDVHMSRAGPDFSCSTCHVSDQHQIAGSRISVTATDPHAALLRGERSTRNPSTCQACHGERPHQGTLLHAGRLNDHSRTLACQSCHIPTFARGGVPTKMAWDWSTAGKLDGAGKPFQTWDANGHLIYDSRKGDFVLGENLVPDYVWFDGTVTYVQPDSRIDPSERVPINVFHGTPGAADSRIWPVKTFHSRQPYDQVLNTLLVPHIAVPDDTAFWYNFDWAKALQAGADATGSPYSGHFGFVDTRMLWPITHMVAPKEQALDCVQCHSRQARLAAVPGIWLPGKDRHVLLDTLGFSLAGLALLGVSLHGALRIAAYQRRRRS